jgi:hypothetical protein
VHSDFSFVAAEETVRVSYPTVPGIFLNIGNMSSKQEQSNRRLQIPPTFTSPPSELALLHTPQAFRSDAAIDEMRSAALAGMCSSGDGSDGSCLSPYRNFCHIPFVPDANRFGKSPIGVVFYGGGLVDPRAYSPLAATLTERYGLPVVIPVFGNDMAFNASSCLSGRLSMAQADFDGVEKWVLVGHSFGGVAASVDLWLSLQGKGDVDIDSIAGLVMLAADVQSTTGCGPIDFSRTTIPMASVLASEDRVLNFTRFNINRGNFPANDTFYLNILGGNHGGFGDYDDTEFAALFNQNDGIATIPKAVQWDISTAAIYHVASRAGLILPTASMPKETTPSYGPEVHIQFLCIAIFLILAFMC